MVEEWNKDRGTVEQRRWNSRTFDGATVEQSRSNSRTEMVEQ